MSISRIHAHIEQAEKLRAENGRLRAALTQIRGFAKVMDENNWRDLRLHIERQCDNEQSNGGESQQ